MCGGKQNRIVNDVILFCKLGKLDAEMRVTVVAVQKQEALLICVLRPRVRFKTAL